MSAEKGRVKKACENFVIVVYLLFVFVPAYALTNCISDIADARDARYSLIARYEPSINYAIAWLVTLPGHRGQSDVIEEWERDRS